VSLAEIPVGLDPEGVAVDSRRRRAYVACSRADYVAVVDLETNEVVAQVVVGSEPIDLAFDPAQDRQRPAQHRAEARRHQAQRPRDLAQRLARHGSHADHRCA